MEGENGNALLLCDLHGKKVLEKVETLRDLAEAWREAKGFEGRKLRMALKRAISEGRVDAWLKSIGEVDVARKMKVFETRFLHDYMEMFEMAYYDRFDGPQHSFSDVIGLEGEKKLLLERISYPHKMAEISRKYGKQSCGNVLLYGPPGCGKTFLAKALAKETGKLFVQKEPVSFLEDVIPPMRAVNNLHEFGGAVLFLDEMETISMEREGREDMRHGTNIFLTTLDALPIDSKVSIIGATNSPWMLEPTMFRSGRFDSMVYVGVPDYETRVYLFRKFSSRFPNKSLDFEALASKTDFYSCADIEEICSEAASIPWRDAIAGKPEREVTQEDFESVLSVFSSTTIPWFENASSVVFSEGGKRRFGGMIGELRRYKDKKTNAKGAAYG